MRKALTSLENVAAAIAGTLITLMMVVVCIDAFARYSLHRPLQWSFELITYYILIAALWFAVSSTFRHGDHISIDLFRNAMPRALRNTLDILWALMAAVAFALVSYGAAHESMAAYGNGDFLPGYLAWPSWLAFIPIVIGAGLLTLRLLLHATMLAVYAKDPDIAAETIEDHFE